MRALITGSSGFVGSHMAAELRTQGYDVLGIDLRAGQHTTHQMDAVDWFRMDQEEISSFGARDHWDLVVHCAYHVGGRAMIDGVPDVLSANVQLDASLFQWALVARPADTLYFSSSAIYPTHLQREHFPFFPGRTDRRLIETDALDPQLTGTIGYPDARYGWAKLNGEKLVEAARQSGIHVTVVRPFSGYGEDQSLDYPFPSIIQRARTGDLSVWGPPGQTRDWIHISDLVSASLAVLRSGTLLPVNLCTGIGTEMGELAQMVYSRAKYNTALELLPILDYGGEPGMAVDYQTDKPTGVHYRVGNPEQMLKYYTPKISLAQGIHRALTRLQ